MRKIYILLTKSDTWYLTSSSWSQMTPIPTLPFHLSGFAAHVQLFPEIRQPAASGRTSGRAVEQRHFTKNTITFPVRSMS